MTRASEDLWNALIGLQRAADRELGGENHRVATQHIADLLRLTGLQGEDEGSVPSDASLGFAAALAEVRSLAERDLSGNTFYIASKKLDELASLTAGYAVSPAAEVHEPVLEPAAPLPEEPAEPVFEAHPAEAAAPAVLQGWSFDELAAAAKDRVEEVAASLGIESVHAHHAPLVHHPEPAPAAVELEKRSSEPCSMPEVLPIGIEPITEASLAQEVAEVASIREVVEAAHDLGSPAAAAVHVPDYAAPHEELAPAHQAPAEPEVPAHAHEAPPAEAAHAPEHIEPIAEQVLEHAAAEALQAAPEPEIAAHAHEAPLAEAAPAPAHNEPEIEQALEHAAAPAPHAAPLEEAAPAPAHIQPEVEPVVEHLAAPAPQAAPEPVIEAQAPAVEPAAVQPAARAPEPAPEPKPKVSAVPPVQEKPSAAAPKKAEAGPKEEPKSKQPQKTFFSLWLDMVFGRKKQ